MIVCLGTMSLHHDISMERPMTSDEIRWAMEDDNDDALRTAGHNPDDLDALTRADLLHEIVTAEMERMTA